MAILLPLDVGEVEVWARGLGSDAWHLLGQHLDALKVVDETEERFRGKHLDLGRPRGLAARSTGTDDAFACGRGADGRRQHTRDRRNRAVEPQFAEGDVAADVFRRQHVHGDQQAEGDGQVEVTAFFQHVGRRKIDGDALGRQGEADGVQRGAHVLAAFPHRLVGQTDDGEGRQSRGDLYLHVPRQNIDALERHGTDACHHSPAMIAREGAADAG